eukprot:4610150-Prymnesium_polylepis.1
MIFSLVAALGVPDSPNIAVVGGVGGDPAALAAKLRTHWALVPATRANASTIGAAAAFVEAPLSMLSSARAAKLYQYEFTGYNESDLASIPAHLAVANCHQSSIPIAEFVMAAVLEWNIRLREMDAKLRSCTWRAGPPGNNCSGARLAHRQATNMTLAILGYGHIGEAIAQRAAAFGMRIVATTLDPPAQPPPPLSWIGDDSDNPRLFREADFLVVCLPLLPSTRGLVGAALLGKMSPSAVLVNVARGPIVDEAALYSALREKRIGGAVLDVWWHDIFELEPGAVGPSAWPSHFRFDLLPNVIMSPHDSGDTPEAREEALAEVAANLDALALGEPLQNVVRPAKSRS